MSKTIVLTGGGTAGHVTPNLALVPELQSKGFDVHYIGTQEGIERQLIQQIPFHAIQAGKLRRYFSLKNISDFFRIFKGYRQSKKILAELNPNLVFAKGGFVSVPVVYAAAKLGIPVVLHESDYTPGLANRICTRKANIICLSFDIPEAHIGKARLTGSPVRASLLQGNRKRGLSFLGFTEEKPVLLIMGGSLGAQAINNAVDSCIDELLQKFQIVHLRGKENLNPALEGKKAYRQYTYLNEDLPDVMASADLALSRAGANAVFEFLALQKPSLLIPLPLSASRGDQIQNAHYFKEKGYACVLPQEHLNCDSIISSLDELVQRKDELIVNMQNSLILNGRENILNIILENAK